MSTLGAVPSAAASLPSTSQIAPGKPFLPRCRISDQGEYHHRCTEACSAQISGYIEEYEVFKAKGIEGTYVVARNDQQECKLTVVHFLAKIHQCHGAYTRLDLRCQRYVMIVNDIHVASLAVEDDPSEVVEEITVYITDVTPLEKGRVNSAEG
ncbi:hypothetical protein EV421DRAFT_1741392 [Armillaria borealis]|uniref:Uncharacterized protein n=1 Tax=Armillaria borealis TaxID=47425 RepID=A0AA39J3H1_9AGAR|nr:hypothetical protein EV421DRAFT_1741392 [Armillaria borealis]